MKHIYNCDFCQFFIIIIFIFLSAYKGGKIESVQNVIEVLTRCLVSFFRFYLLIAMNCYTRNLNELKLRECDGKLIKSILILHRTNVACI